MGIKQPVKYVIFFISLRCHSNTLASSAKSTWLDDFMLSSVTHVADGTTENVEQVWFCWINTWNNICFFLDICSLSPLKVFNNCIIADLCLKHTSKFNIKFNFENGIINCISFLFLLMSLKHCIFADLFYKIGCFYIKLFVSWPNIYLTLIESWPTYFFIFF